MKEHQFEKDGKPITLYWFEIDLYNEDFEKILAMVPIKQNSKLWYVFLAYLIIIISFGLLVSFMLWFLHKGL